MTDQLNQFEHKVILAPVVTSDNTAAVSSTVDMQNRSSADFHVVSGVLADADATFDTKLFEGDASDMSDEVEVTDAKKLIGTVGDFLFSEDGTVKSFGYRGIKRYLRVKVTPTGNAGSAPFCILAKLRKKKVGSV